MTSSTHSPQPSFLHRALLGRSPSHTAPLHGLRTFFNLIVVTGHPILLGTLFYTSSSLYAHHLDRIYTPLSLLSILIAIFFYISVDGFLFISGFFLLHTLSHLSGDNRLQPLSKLQTTPKTLLRYTISRWLRLAPLYLLSLLFYTYRNLPNCPSISEATLLTRLPSPFRSPILPQTHFAQRCIGPGWSTSADFQAQLLLLLIVYLAGNWTRLRYVLPTLVFVCACARGAFHTYNNRTMLPPYIGMTDFLGTPQLHTVFASAYGFPTDVVADTLQVAARRTQTVAYDPLYFSPLLRAGAMLVGAWTWVEMRTNGPVYRLVKMYPRKAWRVVLGMALVHTVLLKPSFFAEGAWWGVVHEMVVRIGMACAMGVVVMITCSVREGEKVVDCEIGRRVRKVFGNKWLVRGARSSYAVYLLHMGLTGLVTEGWGSINASNFGMDMVLVSGVKWYVGSVLMGIPFCVMEEVGLTARKWIVEKAFGQREKQKLKDGAKDLPTGDRVLKARADKMAVQGRRRHDFTRDNSWLRLDPVDVHVT